MQDSQKTNPLARPGQKSGGANVRFPCESCGALQTYAPGTDLLHCEYCGHDTPISPRQVGPIRELPLNEALQRLDHSLKTQDRFTIQCENCAAEFSFDENNHAGKCPFCGTPVVVKPGKSRRILPKSLIPFNITGKEAEERFNQWLSGLWLAPSRLKQAGRATGKLTGVYIPYWTYDSDTRTTYTGERGDAYQVPQRVMVTVNGRRTASTRMVTKVRWTRVTGRVSRFFDDVLVGASRTLPRTITDKLAPWRLEELTSFSEEYLSGFQSELYQVHLDEGFNTALRTMDNMIRGDVARDIGGDFQRIRHIDTSHSRITYKHILLPIYSSAFSFGRKTYRFVINGQTGKVQGERPYSPWKIGLTVFLALLCLGGLALLQGNL